MGADPKPVVLVRFDRFGGDALEVTLEYYERHAYVCLAATKQGQRRLVTVKVRELSGVITALTEARRLTDAADLARAAPANDRAPAEPAWLARFHQQQDRKKEPPR